MENVHPDVRVLRVNGQQKVCLLQIWPFTSILLLTSAMKNDCFELKENNGLTKIVNSKEYDYGRLAKN